jgi:hypothetical protein
LFCPPPPRIDKTHRDVPEVLGFRRSWRGCELDPRIRQEHRRPAAMPDEFRSRSGLPYIRFETGRQGNLRTSSSRNNLRPGMWPRHSRHRTPNIVPLENLRGIPWNRRPDKKNCRTQENADVNARSITIRAHVALRRNKVQVPTWRHKYRFAVP